MAVFGSTCFNRIRRSLAGLSFSGSTTGQIVGFAKKPGKRTMTNLQVVNRTAFTFASKNWLLLSPFNRNKWDSFALNVPVYSSGRQAFISAQIVLFYYYYYRFYPPVRVVQSPFAHALPIWTDLDIIAGYTGTGIVRYRMNNLFYYDNPPPSSRTIIYVSRVYLVPGHGAAGMTSHLTAVRGYSSTLTYPGSHERVFSNLIPYRWYILTVTIMVLYNAWIPCKPFRIRVQA